MHGDRDSCSTTTHLNVRVGCLYNKELSIQFFAGNIVNYRTNACNLPNDTQMYLER